MAIWGCDFLDRPLHNNENGNYRCKRCGRTMDADTAALHKCVEKWLLSMADENGGGQTWWHQNCEK
jgi:hypothetical protein